MTKKREPIDLVGRLASRLSLAEEASPDSKVPPIAVRAATMPSAPVSAPPEPKIVGRESRIEPTFARVRADGTARREPVPPLPPRPAHIARVRPDPRADLSPAPPQIQPAIATEVPPPAAAESIPITPLTEGPSALDGAVVAPAVIADTTPTALSDTALAPEVSSSTDAIDREAETTSKKHVELNLVRLHKEGFLTPQNQRSLIAEEYRIIKRPLLRAAFDHANDPANLNHVVMVTSARPDEGKTFTAVNLAMSVATERDLFVLLIDCDIRRMGLSKKLGLADRKGLMDVLMDPGLTVADVLLRTNIPNLAIIPSGQPVEAATEVFASAKMSVLVDDIATRYQDRFIIFDAPPVLASSEPGVLAVHVGQTVMVVHANETSKRAIAQSIPLVNGCPNVHFVLNRVTLAAGPDRFGYYGTY